MASKADQSLFFRFSNSSCIFILLYVDDIIVTRSTPQETNGLFKNLNKLFALKDLGGLKYFLGVEVRHLDTRLHLSQHKCIQELSKKINIEATKPFLHQWYLIVGVSCLLIKVILLKMWQSTGQLSERCNM